MNIAIYGASNPIANNLRNFLSCQGHKVVTFSRSDRSMLFDLKHFESNSFSGFDLVLHLAHDYKAKTKDFELILEQHINFLGKNETPFIYFSSMSSHPGNPSKYSRQKRQMEEAFSSFGHTVFRLGLVFSGQDAPETNRPFKQIGSVLRYVRLHTPNDVNAPKFFLTSFQDIQSSILSQLYRNEPPAIQDVYSMGPLIGSELSMTIYKKTTYRKMTNIPIGFLLKCTFHTSFYDKLLNLSKGMNTIASTD